MLGHAPERGPWPPSLDLVSIHGSWRSSDNRFGFFHREPPLPFPFAANTALFWPGNTWEVFCFWYLARLPPLHYVVAVISCR